MTDGAPKPRTPARFIAIGCTVSLAVGIVIAGLAGFVFYKISKGIDEIAAAASSWLTTQPQTEAEFGPVQRIEALPRERSLDVHGEKGWFDFRVTGAKASGRARVAVLRRDGDWRAVGARLTVGDRETAFGTPP